MSNKVEALKAAVEHCKGTKNTEQVVLFVAEEFLDWLKQ